MSVHDGLTLESNGQQGLNIYSYSALYYHIDVSLVTDPFTVGQSATARCMSDIPAKMIEWLTNGSIIESATSTQQLNLVFSPVNDSIHNMVYVCRVTRMGGTQAEKNVTVTVNGKL